MRWSRRDVTSWPKQVRIGRLRATRIRRMDRNSHLFVAPLTAAGTLERGDIAALPWQSAKLHCSALDLVFLRCVIAGDDPTAPVSPPEAWWNAFTQRNEALTFFQRHLGSFEAVVDGKLTDIGQAADEGLLQGFPLVVRVPRDLVARLVERAGTDVRALAEQWSSAVSSRRYEDGRPIAELSINAAEDCLATLIGLAEAATTRREDLFVWEPE